ncbi:MAG: hypothetical protein IT438_07685 [Phycisphaerales bacterium]|nr:hypothetical protein [Phycisphaerales bacterium]
MMTPRRAWQLLVNGGPRFYFEGGGASGGSSLLSHPLWRMTGVRFLVTLDAELDLSTLVDAEGAAQMFIERVQDFKAAFLAAQPAGTPFPGYGVRMAGIGGAYAYRDPDGFIPVASHHRLDTLAQFVSAFSFTDPRFPQDGIVTTSGFSPSLTRFRLGSGVAAARAEGGLVNNTVRFRGDTITTVLQNATARVTAWSDGIVTIDGNLPTVPTDGDACTFISGEPRSFRFENARANLAQWSDTFFETIDVNWPVGISSPELVMCTTENINNPAASWFFDVDAINPYRALDTTDPSLLTDALSLNQWIDEYGFDLDGNEIDLDNPPEGVSWSSPAAQDYRSLCWGAFVIGLAWTWQLSFVDRMKRTWPGAMFNQYLLRTGTPASPHRTQPGELFHHGDPWPPDVGHSHDAYYSIFPRTGREGATRVVNKVEAAVDETKFQVTTDSGFASGSGWGDDGRDHIRFATNTLTTALQNQPAIIADWNPTTRGLIVTALPVTPAPLDGFLGYIERPIFSQWQSGIGWDLWPAFAAIYNHTGDLDERYRRTCVSWVTEAGQRMAAAWPNHNIIPSIARYPESEGPQELSDEMMYPDGPLSTAPGGQSRDDWTTMISNMTDSGIIHLHIFEPVQTSTLVLDCWVEILSGVQRHFQNNTSRLELLAPHRRNRHLRRNRRLWRH